MEELWAFQATLHDCFARREPRAHGFDSMVGPCRQLERTSIEPMALQVEGGTMRGLQRFRSDGRWEEDQRRWHDPPRVVEEMGAPEGVRMGDETGCVKKGKDAVGGARQYCGPLGKVAHCHVGVLAGYASRQGDTLVDQRGCLPEVWWTDVYAARRAKCNVPEALTLQHKPPLAAAMGQAMVQERLLPCKSVVADGLAGHRPDFLEAVDACVGVTALVALASEPRCWLQAPRTMDKAYRDKGEARSRRVGVGREHAPCTVAAVAAHLPASPWSWRQVSEGTTGPSA
jgi:SRSO17 transposase